MAGVALAFALAWGLRPLPAMPALDPELNAPSPHDSGSDTIEPLDRTAFAAAIWNPPAAPERPAATVERTTPVPPPKLQLIGIVHDTDEDGAVLLRAALYDPDTDKLHLVASGERVGAVTVASIERGVVSLESAGRTSRLALREEGDRR
ncbi:MAG: hypothetical protein ACF8R9_11925 [Phycisphaerales bacterium JB054]